MRADQDLCLSAPCLRYTKRKTALIGGGPVIIKENAIVAP